MNSILIVDDELQIRELLRTALERQGHAVVTAAGAEQALEVLSQQDFDLMILDVHMPEGSGTDFLEKVRQCRNQVPVIVYTGALTPEEEVQLKQAGIEEVILKNVGVFDLLARVEKTLKTKGSVVSGTEEKHFKSILIVDDDASIRRLLTSFLKAKGFTTVEAESGERAMEIVREQKFSMALLDVNMPGMGGLAALEKLLAVDPKMGVIMVTGEHDDQTVKAAVARGACGYIVKPFDFLYLELTVMSRLLSPGSGKAGA